MTQVAPSGGYSCLQHHLQEVLDILVLHAAIFGSNLTPPIPNDANVCQHSLSLHGLDTNVRHQELEESSFFYSNVRHQELDESSFGYNFFGQMVAPCTQPRIILLFQVLAASCSCRGRS